MPAMGYMVAFVVFYELGFDVLSHQFLHSMLQHFGLDLLDPLKDLVHHGLCDSIRRLHGD
jgi:hypothetical protein